MTSNNITHHQDEWLCDRSCRKQSRSKHPPRRIYPIGAAPLLRAASKLQCRATKCNVMRDGRARWL